MSESKRLNKRQARELQELQELEALGGAAVGSGSAAGNSHVVGEAPADGDENEEGELEADDTTPAPKASLFAQLGEEDEEDESDADEDITATVVKSKSKKKKNKKKKKRNAAAGALESIDTEHKDGEAGDDGQEERDDEDDEPDGEEEQGGQGMPKESKGAKKRRKKREIQQQQQQQQKASEKEKKNISDMSMDDFAALLAAQAKVDGAGGDGEAQVLGSGPPAGSPLARLRANLALAASALDPAIELKRQFGAAAIKAYENEAGGGGGREAARARAAALAHNSNLRAHNILIQPKETWPPIARTVTGLTMEMIPIEGRGKLGAWVHSKNYKRAQLQFLQSVQSYDPNHLYNLLRTFPWHIDTLLQLSDVSRHQGDLGQASDFNARALFAFERTASSAFTGALLSSSGPPQVDFDRIENRGFWLAAHRNVNFLGRRGTWRTALEWVKLLIGLDSETDPHGMILWLDFLSIKARQHRWLLDTIDKWDAARSADLQSSGLPIQGAKTPFDPPPLPDATSADEAKGSLDWCLGLSYARALALRLVEKEESSGSNSDGATSASFEKSTLALKQAMARHPHVLPLLFEKIGQPFPVDASHAIFAMPDAAAYDGHQDAEAEAGLAALLAHVYVSRNESLWKESAVASWLSKTLCEAFPVLTADPAAGKAHGDIEKAKTDSLTKLGIYRHVLVSDLPDALRQTLIGLIPRKITAMQGALDSYDPLPPVQYGEEENPVTRYDDEYFRPIMGGGGGSGSGGQGMRQAPSRGMMQRLMAAMRELRGGMGIEGWENMDDETRQDALAELMMAAHGNGQMPGELAHLSGDEDADGEGAGPEGEQQGPFQLFRNLIGGFWGAEGQAEEEEADAGAQDDGREPRQ
ncbi:DUF654-domain-containing protein [Acaromyces ingoldii]|uniref:DUF654-domain-containing protein n=1 Tax=Acaromyces ingoldii TaxID=215250 RepID=A0A316YH37_9BASI|nr:DUF654-domain-containing protein [Acaromyces ingoldii]PWN88461.1 DUF654-domain-containing protein [Acaromyces ingoldii]